MFGSLILPTGTGGSSFFSFKPPSSSCSSSSTRHSNPRDQLSAIGSTTYHPTMVSPARKSPATRIRAYTLPRLELSKPTTTTTTTLNLYQILRIKQNASPLEIKTAYRRLAKQFHPDASPHIITSNGSSSDGGGRDFMEIHNAYATLSDPTERARYDLSIQIQIQIQTHKHRRSFHRYNSSGSVSAADGNENRSRYVGYEMQTRRWETDQCW